MSVKDETTQTAVILESCEEQLRRVDSARIEELTTFVERLLEKPDFMEDLITNARNQAEIYGRRTDEDEAEKLLRGFLFEEYALQNRPETNSNTDLELFLLSALRNPKIWTKNWDRNKFLNVEEITKLNEFSRNNSSTNAYRAFSNNDALSIKVEVDAATGERVAVVTGVVEAKNHRLRAGSRDLNQMAKAPQQLHDMVTEYRDYIPLICKGLGLGDACPDKIDIWPVSQLSYEILQPEDIQQDYMRVGIPAGFDKCTLSYVPITRAEVGAIADATKTLFIERLKQEELFEDYEDL